MKKSAVLRVVKITDEIDKNQNRYHKIIVSTPGIVVLSTDLGEIPVKVKSRLSSFNAWKNSYLDGEQDFGYDCKTGDILAGTIITRKVRTLIKDGEDVRYEDTYKIKNDGRRPTITDEYTMVVFGDTANELDFDICIRRAFRRAGHPLPEDVREEDILEPVLLADPKIEEKSL